MKNKWLDIYLILLFVILIGGIVIINYQTKKTREAVDVEQIEKYNQLIERKGEQEEKMMREHFMKGCLEEGANQEYCNCFYDYLDRNFSTEVIKKMGIETFEGDISQQNMEKIMDGVEHCYYLIR
jgi:hypothetical protein